MPIETKKGKITRASFQRMKDLLKIENIFPSAKERDLKSTSGRAIPRRNSKYRGFRGYAFLRLFSGVNLFSSPFKHPGSLLEASAKKAFSFYLDSLF